MTAKVNTRIEMTNPIFCRIELWDVDLFVDDRIQYKEITESGEVEFIFSLSETGEFKPELQIRIFTTDGIELFRSNVDSTLNSLSIDKITGFQEVTTIDFGTIKIN
jgi:hypothetical protein